MKNTGLKKPNLSNRQIKTFLITLPKSMSKHKKSIPLKLFLIRENKFKIDIQLSPYII